jgi:hypothetical protein
MLMLDGLKWVLAFFVALIVIYTLVRIFSKAVFKSYFETKKEHLTKKGD